MSKGYNVQMRHYSLPRKVPTVYDRVPSGVWFVNDDTLGDGTGGVVTASVLIKMNLIARRQYSLEAMSLMKTGSVVVDALVSLNPFLGNLLDLCVQYKYCPGKILAGNLRISTEALELPKMMSHALPFPGDATLDWTFAFIDWNENVGPAAHHYIDMWGYWWDNTEPDSSRLPG